MTKLLLGSAALATLCAGAATAQAPAGQAPTAQGSPQVHIMRMNKTQTRTEVAARVRDHFTRIDANRDGFITREESQAVRARMGGMRPEQLAERLAGKGERRIGTPPSHIDRRAAFDRLDTNKDGMISRQEFEAGPAMAGRRVFKVREGGAGAKGGMGRMMGGFHGRMFDMADANKDSRISLQEATDAALRRFDAADLNRDGQLTPEERKQSREQMRGQRRPG